ncbi:hypothetical protein [Pseudomonas saxonica]|uniref:Uncharacterized protein n=1 Tax=Pseudomonas saxonica TaxID=2600598 RepID=A0A5C5PV92_9PSED|nr:hypothetical protein [Pseudomonas saxonica]TWR85058.1 hypothetical protein FJD37_19405 [Pseudomonas saxonica]WRQ75603.1 hypothetical protein VQY67_02750 [Pseudomonas saxonica]
MLDNQCDKQTVVHASDDPAADYAIRLPNAFINRCFADIFPKIKSELRGTLFDEELGATLTWELSEEPEFISPITLPELICYLVISVEVEGKKTASAVVYLHDGLYFVEKSNGYLLKFYEGPYIELTPDDPFLRIVLQNKMSDVISVLNKILGVVLIPRDVPGFFPTMPPMYIQSFPFDAPAATGYALRSFYFRNNIAQQTLSDIEPRVLGLHESVESERGEYDDVFRVQISHQLLEKVITEKFWDPMPKEFAEEGALIRLLSFNLEMEDDYLALMVELGGRVRVDVSGLPDPEWSVDFKAPLDVRLKVFVAEDKTIRIKYDETHFPGFDLVANNDWAAMYESLVPGLAKMIASEVGGAMVSNVTDVVGDIDEFLFELPAETFDIGDKSVTVFPHMTDIRSYSIDGSYYLNFAGVMNTSVNTR